MSQNETAGRRHPKPEPSGRGCLIFQKLCFFLIQSFHRGCVKAGLQMSTKESYFLFVRM